MSARPIVRSLIAGAAVAWATGLPAAAPAARFDAGRAWEDLRQLVAIGPRPAGSAAIEQARRYVRERLAAAGLHARDQAWDETTPLGRVHMVNLIATLPGARGDRIIVAGHYDTKLFHQFRFVGASDGGSSAAFLLELARALEGRRSPFTIELLFLDGEEAVVDWTDGDHTYGSRHYVETATRDGSLGGIKALVLVDMIGDRDLRIRRDLNSTPWLTDIVWAAARRKQLGAYFVPDTTRVEDDHDEFTAAGVPAVDLIDLDYAPWHTAGDDLSAVSARSLQVVGDVVLAALPQIEAHVK